MTEFDDRMKKAEEVIKVMMECLKDCDPVRKKLENSYLEKREPDKKIQEHLKGCPMCRDFRNEIAAKRKFSFSQLPSYWKNVLENIKMR